MDGSPQCGLLSQQPPYGTFDAAEWAPSTASVADMCSARARVRNGPKAAIVSRLRRNWGRGNQEIVGQATKNDSAGRANRNTYFIKLKYDASAAV